MNKDLEMQLVKKYPKILKDYCGDMRKTCMAWGMECGDGWFNLLDKCMEKLQHFCDLCSKDGREVQITANQIKEKFGTLRFYASTSGATNIEDEILHDIIDKAEETSSSVCEETGEYGVPCKRGGWYKTLCRKKARELHFTACNEQTEQYWQEQDSTLTSS